VTMIAPNRSRADSRSTPPRPPSLSALCAAAKRAFGPRAGVTVTDCATGGFAIAIAYRNNDEVRCDADTEGTARTRLLLCLRALPAAKVAKRKRGGR
jgi:hypothetical protein